MRRYEILDALNASRKINKKRMIKMNRKQILTEMVDDEWVLLFDSIDSKGFILFCFNLLTEQIIYGNGRFTYQEASSETLHKQAIEDFAEKFKVDQEGFNIFVLDTGILANSKTCPFCKQNVKQWSTEHLKEVRKDLNDMRLRNLKEKELSFI